MLTRFRNETSETSDPALQRWDSSLCRNVYLDNLRYADHVRQFGPMTAPPRHPVDQLNLQLENAFMQTPFVYVTLRSLVLCLVTTHTTDRPSIPAHGPLSISQ